MEPVAEVLERVEAALQLRLDRASLVRKRRRVGAATDRGTWAWIERRPWAKIGLPPHPEPPLWDRARLQYVEALGGGTLASDATGRLCLPFRPLRWPREADNFIVRFPAWTIPTLYGLNGEAVVSESLGSTRTSETGGNWLAWAARVGW